MFGSIASMVGQLLEAAGSVVGYRHGTEEPDHSVEKLTDNVEIRRYGARIAAETTVRADEESARNAGFRRLARYIFGANRDSQKIAMTAPVEQHTGEDEDVATAVANSPSDNADWVIRFFMPADKTLESLPVPDDAEIRLVPLPPETMAVRRFSGSRSASAVAAQAAELLSTLRDHGFEATDTPAAWFYDPPWTVPPLRRNEIAVPVKRTG